MLTSTFCEAAALAKLREELGGRGVVELLSTIETPSLLRKERLPRSLIYCECLPLAFLNVFKKVLEKRNLSTLVV